MWSTSKKLMIQGGQPLEFPLDETKKHASTWAYKEKTQV